MPLTPIETAERMFVLYMPAGKGKSPVIFNGKTTFWFKEHTDAMKFCLDNPVLKKKKAEPVPVIGWDNILWLAKQLLAAGRTKVAMNPVYEGATPEIDLAAYMVEVQIAKDKRPDKL